MIYPAGVKGPYLVPGYHDPDSIRTMTLRLKPAAWEANTFYNRVDDDYDIIIPSTFKGLAHRVVNPGVSHATTEPTFSRTLGGITEDFQAGQTEGLTFEAIPYAYMLPTVSLSTLSTPTATGGVTFVSSSSAASTITFTLAALGAAVTARTTLTFQATFHYVKSDGDADDITLEFKIGER